MRTGTVMRIGELAREVGTTPRTIRYYEEIGLLPGGGDREAGRHRLYDEEDLARLREVLRLKELLGLSLDELRELVEAEDTRALLREEFHASDSPKRRRDLLEQALPLVERQLALVRRRREQIDALEADLAERRRRIRRRLREDDV